MRKALFLVLAVFVLSTVAIGCRSSADIPEPTIKVSEKTKAVLVYYSTGNTIVEEKHIVPDSKSIIKTALNEVLAAKPQQNKDIAIVQPECKVLDANVDEKGAATINFSKEVLDFEALPKEKVLAYGAIVQTLKQFKEVKSVKFLVEGKDNGTVNGKDVRRFWGSVSLIGQPWPLESKPANK